MPKQEDEIVASLDLHGLTRNQAIRDVTCFLHNVVKQSSNKSTRECWVCIITGSGHHSPAGPVLREAVCSLLQKREMDFTLAQGRGSFIVDANSGHELTAPPKQATDTKVIVKPSQQDDVKLVNRPRITNTASRPIPTPTILEPKPCEVAADDALMARIKSESSCEHVRAQRMQHAQLQQALSKSKQSLDWELEQDARRLEQEIEAALQESEAHEERIRIQEEERLQQVLQQSREEEERIKRQEEERLAAVLLESQQEEERQQRQEELLLQRALQASQTLVLETDQALNEALEQSLHDVHAVDSDLNAALSQSLTESSPPDEHVLIEKALRLSITDSSTMADVDYVIEEVD